jgi:hypothetical protein
MAEHLRDLHGETALRHRSRALHKKHDIVRRDLIGDPIPDFLLAHIL